MKKIIYIFLRRHNYNYDNDMFQFFAFKNKGWDLERWSLVDWTFDAVPEPLNKDKSSNCFSINSLLDFKNNLNRVKEQNCYFLVYPYHDHSYVSMMVRKYIRKYNFHYSNITESTAISVSNCFLPMKKKLSLFVYHMVKRALRFVIQDFLALVKHKKINELFFLRYFRLFFYPFFYKSDYNFVTTNILYYTYPNELEALSKRNILVHADSYDNFLLKRSLDYKNDKKYVVFIDQFLTGHSDCINCGRNFPVQDGVDFFNRLNILFEKIEQDFDCEVIIAAHPKAEYKGNEFGNRKIVYNQTITLIKNSEFPIIINSTCFALICLFKKNFLNISYKDFDVYAPQFISCYKAITGIFNNKVLNISNSEMCDVYKDFICAYNEDSYNNYLNRYVIDNKESVKDKLFYEFVEEKVSKLI